MSTPYDHLTDAEVIRMVDNDNAASLRERALAERLDMRLRDLEELRTEIDILLESRE